MKVTAMILVLLLPLASIATAESYSCRDKNGRLHVADNLMNLPEECLHQADENDPNAPGKVNYVPDTTPQIYRGDEYNRAVNQEEQKQQQRKHQEEGLILRAERLAESYESAVILRKSALRKKSYGFRETIIQAEQEIQKARTGKKEILDVLGQTGLNATEKAQIETFLEKIQD